MSTYKQKLVASKLVDFGGNVGKAMVAAGYSSATAKTPQKLTESKGWQELMKEYVSEVDVLKTHSLLLKAEKGSSYMFPRSEDDNVIKEIIERKSVFKLLYVRKTKTHKIAYFVTPDHSVRLRAADLAYKILGLHSAAKVTYKDPYEGWTDEEIDAEIEKLKKESEYYHYKKSNPKPLQI